MDVSKILDELRQERRAAGRGNYEFWNAWHAGAESARGRPPSWMVEAKKRGRPP